MSQLRAKYLPDNTINDIIQDALTKYAFKNAPPSIYKLKWCLNGIYLAQQKNTDTCDILRSRDGYITPKYPSYKQLTFTDQLECLDFFNKNQFDSISKNLYHRLFSITFPEYLNTNINNVNVFWVDHKELEKDIEVGACMSPLSLSILKMILPKTYETNIEQLNNEYKKAKDKQSPQPLKVFQFKLLDRFLSFLSAKGYLSIAQIRKKKNTVNFRGYHINLTFNSLNAWLSHVVLSFIQTGWLTYLKPKMRVFEKDEEHDVEGTILAHEDGFLYILNAFSPSMCRAYVTAFFLDRKRIAAEQDKKRRNEQGITRNENPQVYVNKINVISDTFKYTIQLDNMSTKASANDYLLGNASSISTPGIRIINVRESSVLYTAADRKKLCYDLKKVKGQVIQISTSTKRCHLKILNDLFPPTSNIDSRHMTHKIADIVWSYLHPSAVSQSLDRISIKKRVDNVNKIFRLIVTGTNMVVTLLAFHMYLGHTRSSVIYNEILATGVLLLNSIDQHRVLKSLSSCYRRTSVSRNGTRLSPEDVSSLVYWELAYGRSLNVSDWAKEKENRCTRTCHISSVSYDPKQQSITRNTMDTKPDAAFYTMLEEEIVSIANILVPERPVKESFFSFCQRRQEWTASGSSSGATITLPLGDPLIDKKSAYARKHQTDSTSVKLKVGKRGFYESITAGAMSNYLHLDKPKELAVASEKMENGKSRAIYSVVPNHYAINTYATHGLEERLYLVPGLEKGLSGVKEYAQQRRRALITHDDNIECTMLDYADFNIQHTPEAQHTIFSVFARTGLDRGFHPDWVKANNWVAEAKFNQKVVFPHVSGEYDVKQGMFSGTRSTDLINTILNLAYFNVAKRQVKEIFSLQPLDLYSVHQGDDVWISNKSKHWAALLYRVMQCMGFVFQPSKQMFGTRRGEFLRVLYADGLAVGYAARVMTNYILRPVQGSVSIDIAEWAQTLSNSYSVMARRGFFNSYLNILYDNDIYYWVKVRAHIRDKKPIIIPDAIIMTPCDLGGLGASRPGFSYQHNKQIAPIPQYSSQVPLSASKIPSHMTDDWINYVCKKLPPNCREINVNVLRMGMLFCNYADVLADIGNSKFRVKYKEEWSSWLTHNGAAYRNDSIEWMYKVPASLKSETNASILCTELTDVYELAKMHKYPKPRCEPLSIYGTAVVANLTTDSRTPARYMFSSTDILARISARSLFKSVEATAKSLGLTKIQAIRWILSENASNSMVDPEKRALLDVVLDSDRSDVLELLTSGSFGWLSPFLQLIHPGIVINAYNEAKQCAIASSFAMGKTISIYDMVKQANLIALQFIRCWYLSSMPFTKISF